MFFLCFIKSTDRQPAYQSTTYPLPKLKNHQPNDLLNHWQYLKDLTITTFYTQRPGNYSICLLGQKYLAAIFGMKTNQVLRPFSTRAEKKLLVKKIKRVNDSGKFQAPKEDLKNSISKFRRPHKLANKRSC